MVSRVIRTAGLLGGVVPPPPPPPVHHAQPAEQPRRGGWFNKCQELCAAVLEGNETLSMELAQKFWAKKGDD